MPEVMGVRRQTVEHPFGTLKVWMGATSVGCPVQRRPAALSFPPDPAIA